MKTLLLGDVSPTKDNASLFSKKDTEKLFGDTVSLFLGNDINFVNLECALTESENEIKKYGPALKGPIETADVLKELGVNYVGFSNNHIFDFGKKGFFDTVRAFEKANIKYTGFGDNYEDSRKNLVVEKDGEKICIIAVCEHEYSYALENRMGSRPYDEYDTIEDIRNAKTENDRVIVIYHGGKEHSQYPSPRLYKACHKMVDNGADVVLCQHSHCIGCYENYNNSHILYGQGNFHFVYQKTDSRPKTWNGSLAVKYDTKENTIDFVPLVCKEQGIMIAKGKEKDEIMSLFNKRNQKLLSGEWRNEWHNFCETVREHYTNAIGNAFTENSDEYENGLFGHFLDCEAHTDVWRELFPTDNHKNEI